MCDQGEDWLRCVAEAAFELRSRKAGGLIVLERGVPLADHLRFFTEAYEPVSSDGILGHLYHEDALFAVYLAGGRVVGVEAALPFDISLVPGPEYGSRHTCARTLTSRTDALAVVVSEERNNVVLSVGGEMVVVPTKAGLVKQLHSFFG